MALRRKILSPAVLPSLGDLLSLASKTIATDFPLATARNYVRAVQNVASIDTCMLGPPYSYHPDPSTTDGRWVSRLDMPLVMNLSVAMFGQDSRYYGVPGISAVACNEEPE
jgi:hypothetical protein